jgi:sporulation protein YlmC with PRC-barrel domain
MLTSFFEELYRLVAVDEDGRVLGEVKDLVIDRGTLHLAALRITLRRGVAREVGARQSLFRAATVDVPAPYVRAVADGLLLLSLSTNELARLVTVDAAMRSVRLELLAAQRPRVH